MTYEQFLARRSPAVRERIMRLNPEPIDQGRRLRGWHPSQQFAAPWNRNVISALQARVELGEDAFAAMRRAGPPCVKHGRRHYYGWARVMAGVMHREAKAGRLSTTKEPTTNV